MGEFQGCAGRGCTRGKPNYRIDTCGSYNFLVDSKALEFVESAYRLAVCIAHSRWGYLLTRQ